VFLIVSLISGCDKQRQSGIKSDTVVNAIGKEVNLEPTPTPSPTPIPTPSHSPTIKPTVAPKVAEQTAVEKELQETETKQEQTIAEEPILQTVEPKPKSKWTGKRLANIVNNLFYIVVIVSVCVYAWKNRVGIQNAMGRGLITLGHRFSGTRQITEEELVNSVQNAVQEERNTSFTNLNRNGGRIDVQAEDEAAQRAANTFIIQANHVGIVRLNNQDNAEEIGRTANMVQADMSLASALRRENEALRAGADPFLQQQNAELLRENNVLNQQVYEAKQSTLQHQRYIEQHNGDSRLLNPSLQMYEAANRERIQKARDAGQTYGFQLGLGKGKLEGIPADLQEAGRQLAANAYEAGRASCSQSLTDASTQSEGASHGV
jgi:hypothetical protein